jgi:hypothetical protein
MRPNQPLHRTTGAFRFGAVQRTGIVRRRRTLERKSDSVSDMATEHSLSAGNLGTVLETYGGKSLKRIVSVGMAIFGCALTAMTLIRVFRPDYLGLMLCVFVFGLGIALGYISSSWNAAHAKVEVCESGVRLLVLSGVIWKKGFLRPSAPGIVELPWDRILKVKVGKYRKVRGPPHDHVVIRTTDGMDIEIPFFFFEEEEAQRFATIVRSFVEDVEVDVDFV